ncbi:flagellin [Psychrosphaera haliotis]|uniref:Flagellin n=1 Tax=Psychrosphaera haliotis TaxID=555083 RepID=A0A6N8F7N1_9GAMM|nr:flagellin [Psychrosphaera haliotis]MUH72184.1 flagellin [Psychrosphaera haliotis]
MALFVNTNVASINGQRNLMGSTNSLETSMNRLASGLRINSARDDAAGLQISNRLTSQINGLNVAMRNANDGISMAQTAEGAMQESTNILQRMRDLSIQSANATNSTVDRKALQEEVIQLKSELDRIANTTTFGGQKLIDGSFGVQQFQVGSQANETIAISINSAQVDDLGSARYKMGGTNLATSPATNVGTAVTGLAHPLADANGETLTIGGINSSQVSINQNDSAADMAAKISSVFNTTGVKADAKTVARMEGFANMVADDGISFVLANGDPTDPTVGQSIVSFTASGVLEDDLQTLVNKVNENSAVSGIGAKYDAATTSIVLTSEDGNNIVVQDFTDSGTGNATFNMQGRDYGDGSDVGAVVAVTSGAADDVTVKGQLQLDSTVLFSVSSDTAGGGASDLTGLADTVTAQASEENIQSVDITTSIGAQNAIAIIDGALSKIDRNRATLGAVQNRLQSTISNLANIVENSSGARARIRDTDFATETAELTRNQILQQAGTSILAQANQLPQAALSLLGN